MTRAVFLDRDGVVNRAIIRDGKPYPPSSLAELRLLPGVLEACRKLREAGFALILITNQPDIARGAVSSEQVDAIHRKLRQFLQLDDVQVCPHDDADRCTCRKPRPGLLLEAARRWNIDLKSSFVVGDRWRDIEAGRRAGLAAAVLVDYGYAEGCASNPDARVSSLLAAADWILGRQLLLEP